MKGRNSSLFFVGRLASSSAKLMKTFNFCLSNILNCKKTLLNHKKGHEFGIMHLFFINIENMEKHQNPLDLAAGSDQQII